MKWGDEGLIVREMTIVSNGCPRALADISDLLEHRYARAVGPLECTEDSFKAYDIS